jgi:hypothetical protein
MQCFVSNARLWRSAVLLVFAYIIFYFKDRCGFRGAASPRVVVVVWYVDVVVASVWVSFVSYEVQNSGVRNVILCGLTPDSPPSFLVQFCTIPCPVNP